MTLVLRSLGSVNNDTTLTSKGNAVSAANLCDYGSFSSIVAEDFLRYSWYRGQRGRSMKLTTHLHLRMRGAVRLLFHTSSWRGA
jgi:hypothetical protein